MKRLIMCLVWFVVLYFGIMGVAGALVGSAAGSGGKSFNQGYQFGYVAGQEFGKKYATVVLLIAVGGAMLGTFTDALPGTKPKAK
jgi:hypothetical protein